jgi:integral membrane protein
VTGGSAARDDLATQDPTSAPDRPSAQASATGRGTILPGPRTLYRVFATAEMFTWALLIVAMVLKYSGTTETLMSAAGGLHGFVFLCYCVVAVVVWINQGWGAGRGIAAVLLAAVPFATLPFERSLERKGEPDTTWRLVDGRAEPRGFWESFEAWVLRNVVVAGVLALAVVGLVFVALLTAGPPDQWFG